MRSGVILETKCPSVSKWACGLTSCLFLLIVSTEIKTREHAVRRQWSSSGLSGGLVGNLYREKGLGLAVSDSSDARTASIPHSFAKVPLSSWWWTRMTFAYQKHILTALKERDFHDLCFCLVSFSMILPLKPYQALTLLGGCGDIRPEQLNWQREASCSKPRQSCSASGIRSGRKMPLSISQCLYKRWLSPMEFC